MSLRFASLLALLLLAILAGVAGYAFVVQNANRTVMLSLNLYFFAWRLAEPVPVTALIGGAFGLGLAGPTVLLGVRNVMLNRRLRRLERDAALGNSSYGSSSYGSYGSKAADPLPTPSAKPSSERSEWR